MEKGKEEGKEEEIYENVRKEGFFKSLYAFLSHPFASIWKAVRYDSLFQQHTENVNKLKGAYGKISDLKEEINMQSNKIHQQEEVILQKNTKIEKQDDEIFQQYNHINRLIKREDDLFGRACELVNRNENLEGQVEFFVNEIERNVEENPGYQNLEKEREGYKKQFEDMGKFIDHLKNDKKNLVKFLNTFIDKIPETIMDYFKKDKEYRKPIIFVNSHGVIIGNTSVVKDVLGINYELLGRSGYKLLGEVYPDLKDSYRLRKFFNTREERAFSMIVSTTGRRKIEITLTKGEPSIIKDLDLRVIGRNKTIETIAFVPVYINVPGALSRIFLSKPDLATAIGKFEKQEKKIYAFLVTEGKLTLEEIETIKQEKGPDGLKAIYKNLKKEKKLKKK